MIRRITFRRCGHPHVECIHGDLINHADGARARCVDCGRALKYLPLPEPCTGTGRPHHSAIRLEANNRE